MQDDGNIFVYKVTLNNGSSCHFGELSTANVYARNSGKVEKLEVKTRKLSVIEDKNIDEEVDQALDRILKASGSALKHYSMPSVLEKMRGEMLAIMKRSYVDGSNACHRAMTAK